MGKRRAPVHGYRRGGSYNFSYKRKAALYRAAKISAEKRRKNRIKTLAVGVGVIGGVAAGAYAGHKYGPAAIQGVSKYKPQAANIRNRLAARLAVAPSVKEDIRVASSISVAHPSATTVPRVIAPITDADRARAKATNDALARKALPPHMGGPDRRVYDEDNNVDSEKMTNRSASRTLRNARKRTQGTKVKQTVNPKAVKKPGAEKHNGLTEAEWSAALGFEEKPSSPAPIKRVAGTAAKGTTSKPKKQSVPKPTQQQFSSAAHTHVHSSPVGSTHSYNDLHHAYKENPHSIRGKKIALWSQFSEMDKAMKREHWATKGFFIHDSGEMGLL